MKIRAGNELILHVRNQGILPYVIADEIDKRRHTVYAVLNGKTKNPHPETLKLITRYYNQHVEEKSQGEFKLDIDGVYFSFSSINAVHHMKMEKISNIVNQLIGCSDEELERAAEFLKRVGKA